MLEAVAAEWGLTVLGASTVESIRSEESRLRIWQEKGHAADLEYMKRDSALFVSPQEILSGARTVLSFTLQYDPGSKEAVCPVGYGRIARYARGRDYHKVLKKLLRKLLQELQARLHGNLEWRIFTDAVPLLERAFARNAGLGFVGKNTMLIQPGQGSFFFIGEALIDAAVIDVPPTHVRGSCGTCARCLNACPTEAFIEAYQLDARRCISYLTIEKKGLFSTWEQQALGEWVFGCDICQEVCPFNYRRLKKEVLDFYQDFRSASYIKDGCINLEFILSIRTDEEYLKRFAGTPLMRARRAGLLRNASCVVANTAAFSLAPVLIEVLAKDTVPEIRITAVYALSRLKRTCDTEYRESIQRALERALTDSEQGVRDAAKSGLQ